MKSDLVSRLSLAAVLTFFLPLPTSVAASTVAYSGKIIDLFGTPGNDLVIAGTFAPGENPGSIIRRYADSSGNFGSEIYSASVRAGYFRPIGNGTIAVATGINSGAFSGTGEAIGIDGLPIYLWAFDNPTASTTYFFAWCTGSDSTWSVTNGGSTSINAATANQYYVGSRGISGEISLGVSPIPEPALFVMSTVPMSLIARRPRRSNAR